MRGDVSRFLRYIGNDRKENGMWCLMVAVPWYDLLSDGIVQLKMKGKGKVF